MREFKRLEKHFVIAMIFLGKKELSDELEFRGIKLSRADALEFTCTILRMFQFEKELIHEVDESAAQAIIDSIEGIYTL